MTKRTMADTKLLEKIALRFIFSSGETSSRKLPVTHTMMWQQEVKVVCYDGQTGLLADSSGKVSKKSVIMRQSHPTTVLLVFLLIPRGCGENAHCNLPN